MRDPVIIIGMNNSSHDTSAALLIDGRVTACSAEERFDRVKHSGAFPVQALDFCIREAAVDINQVQEICFGFDWRQRAKDRFDLLAPSATPDQRAMLEKDNEGYAARIATAERVLRDEHGYAGTISFYDHYDCHASACYFPSPFPSAAVLILDGAGERASGRIYSASGSALEPLLQVDFPNSLGRFYSAITDYLGFKVDSDEGKIMGLAAYGTPALVDRMKEVVRIRDDGTYDFDRRFLALFEGNRKGFSREFIEVFGPKRMKGEPLERRHEDIAFAAQAVLEDAMLGMVRLAKKLTGESALCIGGGVALNSVANGKILSEKIFDDVYVYPASADDGTAVGAALYAYHRGRLSKEFHAGNQSPYLGYRATEEEIVQALKRTGLPYRKSADVFGETARLLADHKIVGWFSGRAEIGPRALGNRCILANPTRAETKDILNATVKFREGFRPFAPSVPEEYADEYCETGGAESPYMILAFPVRPSKRAVIPAVTHVDGTARLQTVSAARNERYWKLLQAFHALTGIPVLLNTSFNRNTEPIVNTPAHAVEAFLGSGLDALVLEDYLVEKVRPAASL